MLNFISYHLSLSQHKHASLGISVIDTPNRVTFYGKVWRTTNYLPVNISPLVLSGEIKSKVV
jgi:hypothetical protein